MSAKVLRLTGQGREFVFRLETVQGEAGRQPVTFVQHKGAYVGVYQPDNGWVALTRASRFTPESEVVRAARYIAALIWSGSPAEKGFELSVQEEGGEA